MFKISKCTNLDIKDAACLHIAYNLQHPTSRPITKSTQTTMVIAPKKNVSPLPACKYGKSTKRSTQRCHQANEGKRRLETARVRDLGALCSFRSKKNLAAEKCRETYFLSNGGKATWIENFVQRETAGARKRHGLRIMFREKPLGQEIKRQMQRQRLASSRKIHRQLKTWD